MKKILALIIFSFSLNVWAEDNLIALPPSKKSLIPYSDTFAIDNEYSRRYKEIMERETDIEKRTEEIEKLMKEYAGKTSIKENIHQKQTYKEPIKEVIKPPKPRKTIRKKTTTRSRYRNRSSNNTQPLQVFFESSEDDGYIIPAGSYVLATLMSGVEATMGELAPALVELDGLIRKPNGEILNLTGCRGIVKVRGDASRERGIVQGESISCSRSGNRNFQTKMNAFAADAVDDMFAVGGEYHSRQGRVFAQAVIAKLAEGAGKAVALTHMSEMVAGSENAAIAKNFTGKTLPFALAQGVADSGEMIARWYLEHARNLLPYIQINSGQKLWLVTLESISVPHEIIEEIN